MQHGALLFDGVGVTSVQLDGSAQLLGAVGEGFVGMEVDAENLEDAPHHNLQRMGHGGQHVNQRGDHRRYRQGRPIGILEGIGLGKNLPEDDDEKGHGECGIKDPGLAEEGYEETGGERRTQDVDDVVAQKDGPKEPFLLFEQPVEGLSPVVALQSQLMQQRLGGCGERRFGSREEGRKKEEDGDGRYGNQHGFSRRL